MLLTLTNHSISDINNLTYTDKPTYISELITTICYNKDGKLNCKIRANSIYYFDTQQFVWFIKPFVTMLDENKMQTWAIKADKAKLTKNNKFYLYGYIQIDNCIKSSQIKQIKTYNAVVDLSTQEIILENKVMLYGINFNSTSMKMRYNLRDKTAELIDNVKTCYKIGKLYSTF